MLPPPSKIQILNLVTPFLPFAGFEKIATPPFPPLARGTGLEAMI